jgi:outer membrane lipoprotein carrier protein
MRNLAMHLMTYRTLRSLRTGALALAISTSAFCGARAQLDQFSSGMQSLSGEFAQRIVDARGKIGDQSKGNLALRAPSEFRWQTKAPSAQLIVADGQNVFSYDEDLEQVTVRPQGNVEANSPLAVLMDLTLLEREYKVKEIADEGGMQWLRLSPKSKDADFKFADLGMSGNALRTMRLADNFGQVTEISFSKLVKNPKLPAKTFLFTPPPGVDVVGEAKPGAQVQKLPD